MRDKSNVDIPIVRRNDRSVPSPLPFKAHSRLTAEVFSFLNGDVQTIRVDTLARACLSPGKILSARNATTYFCCRVMRYQLSPQSDLYGQKVLLLWSNRTLLSYAPFQPTT